MTIYTGKTLVGGNGTKLEIFGYPLPNYLPDYVAKNIPYPWSVGNQTSIFDVSSLNINNEVVVSLYQNTSKIYGGKGDIYFEHAYYRARDDYKIISFNRVLEDPEKNHPIGSYYDVGAYRFAAWIGYASATSWYQKIDEISENGEYYFKVTATGGVNLVETQHFTVIGVHNTNMAIDAVSSESLEVHAWYQGAKDVKYCDFYIDDDYHGRKTHATTSKDWITPNFIYTGLSGSTKYNIRALFYDSAHTLVTTTSIFEWSTAIAAPIISVESSTATTARIRAHSKGADSFRLEYRDNTTTTWVAFNDDHYDPIDVTGLVTGRTYDFRVRAVKGTEYSPYSSIIAHYIGNARPNNWDWEFAITSGGSFYNQSGNNVYLMRAAHWNQFVTRINDFRKYKSLPVFTFTIATTSTTEVGIRNCINQAIDKINDMLPSGKMPNVYARDSVSAIIFINMKNKLNSIT